MRTLTATAAAAAFLLVGLTAPQRGAVEPGQDVSYTFRDIPFNGMGVKSFDELRGKPVLVDFWGTR